MGKDFPYYCLWRLLEPDALPAYEAFLHDVAFKLPGVTHIRSSVVLKEVKANAGLPIGRAAKAVPIGRATRAERTANRPLRASRT